MTTKSRLRRFTERFHQTAFLVFVVGLFFPNKILCGVSFCAVLLFWIVAYTIAVPVLTYRAPTGPSSLSRTWPRSTASFVLRATTRPCRTCWRSRPT